jgi:hypothetical protein
MSEFKNYKVGVSTAVNFSSFLASHPEAAKLASQGLRICPMPEVAPPLDLTKIRGTAGEATKRPSMRR